MDHSPNATFPLDFIAAVFKMAREILDISFTNG
jgi:hypothetical protein